MQHNIQVYTLSKDQYKGIDKNNLMGAEEEVKEAYKKFSWSTLDIKFGE